MNEYEQEVYPDLGLMLANREVLIINDQTMKKIEQLARNCYQICSQEKEIIRQKQDALKLRLKKSGQKGDLTRVAAALNEIEILKKKWLHGHFQRYQQGIALLTPPELKDWIHIEQMVKPFPTM